MRTHTITETLAAKESRGHWILALPAVSLDRALPYWEPMDLRFHRPARVLKALRDFTLAEEALPGHPDSKTYGRKVLTLTRTLLRDLREAEGNRARGDQAIFVLWNWFQLGCDEEPKWHWMWRILMYHLPEVVLSSWGLPKDKAQAITALAERFSDGVREVETRSEILRTQPRSPWDELRYRYYNRDGIDADPLDAVGEAMDRIRFDRTWAEVVALLSLREMELLVRWGRHHAAEIESWKDEETRKTDVILGHRALQVRDAIVPAEWRLFH